MKAIELLESNGFLCEGRCPMCGSLLETTPLYRLTIEHDGYEEINRYVTKIGEEQECSVCDFTIPDETWSLK